MTTERDTCSINRCGRPFGIGTHMRYGNEPSQTLQVCEEHWQALREIRPVEVDYVMFEGER